MLYLVSGTVFKYTYMSENIDSSEQQRLVDASSEGDAIEKFENHFESPSKEYEIYYNVRDVSAFGIIY